MLPCKYINAPRDAEVDFLLTMALDVHDNDLLCSSCGDYVAVCQVDGADGAFAPDDSTICYRTAARESFAKESGELEPGTLVRFVDTRISKAPERTQYNTDRARPSDPTHDTLA